VGTSNFYNCLSNSLDKNINDIIYNILRTKYRTGIVIQNISSEDDKGIDYSVLYNNKKINVDVKIRNWSKSRTEDIVLEYLSNTKTRKIGWSVDKTKKTDVVLWYWLQDKQHYFAKFKDIVRACKKKKREWLLNYYRYQTTDTGAGYQSLSAFVPITEFEKTVKEINFWEEF